MNKGRRKHSTMNAKKLAFDAFTPTHSFFTFHFSLFIVSLQTESRAPNIMPLFGLTGGIGSGKSVIAEGLRRLGYAVYDSDREAQRIMVENPCVRSRIELLFGSDIYTGNCLNRKEVARQVFTEADLLERLNNIVHPAVGFDLSEWAKRQTGICFVESAILFESGLDRMCTTVVCVSAPLPVRIARVVKRDHTTEAQVRARIKSQMSEDECVRRSGLTVINDGQTEISNLCLQIQNFCSTFAG